MADINDQIRAHESDDNRSKKLEAIRQAVVDLQESGGGAGVESVSGDLVDNTDPANPTVTSAAAIAALLAIGTPTAGQVLTVNAGGDGVEWTTPA